MTPSGFMAVFDTVGARAQTDASPVRSIAITSSIKKEGTSTVALGTALSFAGFDSSASVLLVDANWLHPSLTDRAGLKAARGVADCLRDGYSGARAVVGTARRGLSLLPAGQFAEEAPPLGGLAALLAELRRDFAKIVVDLPPILVAPSLVVPWVDATERTYLVVRRGATPVALIKKAMAELPSGRPPQLILNRSRDREDAWERAG